MSMKGRSVDEGWAKPETVKGKPCCRVISSDQMLPNRGAGMLMTAVAAAAKTTRFNRSIARHGGGISSGSGSAATTCDSLCGAPF